MVDSSPKPISGNPDIVGYSFRGEAIYRNSLPPDLDLDALEPPYIRRRRLKPIQERIKTWRDYDWGSDFPYATYGPHGRITFSTFTLPKSDQEAERWEDVDVFIGDTDHYTALRVVTGLDNFGQLKRRHTKADLNYRRSRSGKSVIIARFRTDSLHHIYNTPTDFEVEAVLRRSRASYYDFYGKELFANPHIV